jgi:sec-independent protein translocase protein TatC
MSTSARIQQDDDPFVETRMSFGDHIEELRNHLLRAVYGFLIAFAIACFLGQPVVEFISRPVEVALAKYWRAYYQRKAIQLRQEAQDGRFDKLLPIHMTIELKTEDAKALKEGKRPARSPFNIRPGFEELIDALEIPGLIDTKNNQEGGWVAFRAKIPHPEQYVVQSKIVETFVAPMSLKALSVQEGFVAYFKVSAFVGLVLGAPWVLWQLWSFVAVGLYPHEKKYVYSYFPISIGLFLAGVIMCEFFVLPQAIEALLWFNSYLNMQPDFRFSEWLTFALLMPLVFGLCFQTPLVMLFLNRMGLVSVQTYRKGRSYAIFFLVVFATLILPSPDIGSMLLLSTTLCLFYEVGIWMCVWSPAKQAFESGSEESNEQLVEV